MRVEQLKQVVVLEDKLSISQAAKALYMTQPALSMSLTNLEKELGIKLFTRSANGIAPTEEEQAISCFVRGILQDMHRLAALKEQYGDKAGEVRLAAAPLLYDWVVMRSLGLKQSQPGLKLTILATAEEQILNSLYTGQSDMAVMGCLASQWERLERQLKIKRISFEPLMEAGFKLCLQPQQALAAKASVHIRELGAMRVIYPRRCGPYLQRYGLLEGGLAVDDQEVLKRLVMAGYGVGLTLHHFADNDPYFTQGQLVLKDVEGLEKSKIAILYDKQRCLYGVKQELVTRLKQTEGL